MTYYGLLLLGRAVMGIGKSPEEAISDAKYYHENECGNLPDDPHDEVYSGHTGEEYRLTVLPEAVYKYVREHGTGGEGSFIYLQGYMEGLHRGIQGMMEIMGGDDIPQVGAL
jgi:hypothetical protein